MNNNHTDAELLLATQIAYLNITLDKLGKPVNVSSWIRQEKAYLEGLKTEGKIIPQQQKQLDTINTIEQITRRDDLRNTGWENWTVVDARDHSSRGLIYESGMYASLINTGDGNAIVAFRGSESYDTVSATQDWILADLGLHNSTETIQQRDAEAFMSSVYEEYGDEYSSFDVTGHSLGGNLAAHATLTAPEGMRNVQGRCVNFDGPGFSEEYLAAHISEIGAMSGKVDHYSWSAVGALLFSLPGSNYKVVYAETPDNMGSEIKNLAYRHDVKNVVLVNGSVIEGERDPLALTADFHSKRYELFDSILIPREIKAVLLASIAVSAIIFTAISSAYHSFIQVPAEYYVNTTALSQTSDEFKKVSSQIRDIAEEVNAIAGNLHYNSFSGFLISCKLRRMSRSIENDFIKANEFASALNAVSNNYISSDNNVSMQF